MDRHTRAFVVASLAYLVTAAALGLWMGTGEAPDWAWFAHVHFNLLGFMAMMIYGVGYFIIPRFNARPLLWPGGVPLHFYAANTGLLGMVVTYPERPSMGFVLFSLISLLSVAMFAVNLGATVAIPLGKEKPSPEKAAPPRPLVTPDTRMGEIISRWPRTVDVLVQNGFPALADPAHREKVKQLPVTLKMACANHGVDLDGMTGLLNEAISGGKGERGDSPGDSAGVIGPDDVIGDVLSRHPETGKVFKKYYGGVCFSCPGQARRSARARSCTTPTRPGCSGISTTPSGKPGPSPDHS